VTNPFEDNDATYVVLVNEENQHSLWPFSVDVPQGWSARYEGARQDCLDYVEAHWTDLRPASLAMTMGMNR
jgi:MbtH protein